ncbi:Pimeloyl-ACP methyl ester carboxylesterase [Pseudobutyrivibrio sp. C4]|uniref:alpha/beta fold hydrolase n=1 Tax=Pseudobutyrivibrio sp. C4 TaxID=1520803 RepID=UPI0008D489D6|nr:alpha/beta fold hydrolase [Pseudobutyrivibrio sp. C4]SET04518.1 Pimeloyl-ACP methyl ester carboxylesterase [Pseudobutyrivibrio sp. C4]
MKKALKITGKILRGILILLVSAVIILLVVRLIGKAINEKTPDGGINESMFVDINGTKQWINIYGQDKDNPVLLYLHGGPGSATSQIDYAFTRKWSDVYTVVTWDQRNCGKSYETSKTDMITAETMMQDGKEMTEYLLDYMDKEKITLLGHSWGSLFGANLVLEYPEYYDAFIGTGQFIDYTENEQRLYEAAQEWSEGDEEGKSILAKWSPDNVNSIEGLQARNEIMERYGYGMMKDGTDYNVFVTVLFNPNYTINDYIGYVRNGEKSFKPYMDFLTGEIPKLSLLGRYDYQVPFYNINGDMDYQTNYWLACEYFEQVSAPRKEMFVMEEATHGLLESRSEEFSEILHKIAEIQKNS